jgi:hypothetical protein
VVPLAVSVSVLLLARARGASSPGPLCPQPVYTTSRWEAKLQPLQLSNLSCSHCNLVAHIPKKRKSRSARCPLPASGGAGAAPPPPKTTAPASWAAAYIALGIRYHLGRAGGWRQGQGPPATGRANCAC